MGIQLWLDLFFFLLLESLSGNLNDTKKKQMNEGFVKIPTENVCQSEATHQTI